MAKKILNNNISDNGALMKKIADWFEKNVTSAKQKFKATKVSRAKQIVKTKTESSWDTIKYYLQQLHNANKVGINSILENFTKMAKVGLVDNAVLRKMEKAYAELKNDDKKFVQWLRKHPSLSSYFSYWLLIAALSFSTWGGIKIAENSKEKKEKDKQEIIIEPEDNEIIVSPEDEKGKKKKGEVKSKVYDVTDANFVNNFVEENWEAIVIGLLEFETYRPKPKLQQYETRYTYGPGLTWVYTKDKAGNIIQNPCTGKHKDMAAKFSDKEIWEQVRIHITYKSECLQVIKRLLKENGITKATTEQIMGLFFASYQLPAHAKGIIEGLSEAGNNKQKQIDAFQYYKGKQKWRDGTLKRRWWCAMYYIGKIGAQDLLKLNRDVFSASDINTLLRKKHFKQDDATIAYALALTNNRSTVEEFIEQHKLFKISDDYKKSKRIINYKDSVDNPSMNEMLAGLKAYQSGNYDVAIQHYQKAIELDADNMEAYSSISISYKKLGDKHLRSGDIAKAEDCYNKSIEAVKNGNKRMNANKDLLLDREIKAYLYYNAGQARDALAGIYVNKNDVTNAIREYDLAAKNYKTAIDNAQEIEMDTSLIDIYKTARKQSLSNKAELSKKQKAQKATQKTKKAKIQSATSKVKAKGKKKTFADAIMFLKKGKTFDARPLFGKSRGEYTA